MNDTGDDRNTDDFELVDLIDSDVELTHWVDGDGQPVQHPPLSPLSSEVCVTRPSVELSPFRSEHEGYMGNYGNTVDRWYRRAALVMWPRERDFVIRAKSSPAGAARTLAALVKSNARSEARAKAKELVPF